MQSNVHYKQTFTVSWSKSVTVSTLRTGARLENIKHFAIYFHVEQQHFCFEVLFTQYIGHFTIVRWRFQKYPLSVLERWPSYREYNYRKMTEKGGDLHQVSVLERCPSYREYNYSKMTEERQWPTLGVCLNKSVRLKEVSVRLVDVSVKTELNVITAQAETFSLALPQVRILENMILRIEIVLWFARRVWVLLKIKDH